VTHEEFLAVLEKCRDQRGALSVTVDSEHDVVICARDIGLDRAP
jgi:hypothetical protein